MRLLLALIVLMACAFAIDRSDFKLDHVVSDWGHGCQYYYVDAQSLITDTSIAKPTSSIATGATSDIRNGNWEVMTIKNLSRQVWQSNITCKTEISINMTEFQNCTDNGKYITEYYLSNVWEKMNSTYKFPSKAKTQLRYCADYDMKPLANGWGARIDMIPSFGGFIYTEYAWYDVLYGYCTQITPAGGFNSNYSHLIILNSTVFNYSHAKSDLTDLRFLEGTCTNPNTTAGVLPIWNESINTSGNSQIAVRSVNADVTSLAMYYNNSAATSIFNGSATFIWFKDVPSGTWSTGWTNYSTTNYLTVTGNNMTTYFAWDSNMAYWTISPAINLTNTPTETRWKGSARTTASNVVQIWQTATTTAAAGYFAITTQPCYSGTCGNWSVYENASAYGSIGTMTANISDVFAIKQNSTRFQAIHYYSNHTLKSTGSVSVTGFLDMTNNYTYLAARMGGSSTPGYMDFQYFYIRLINANFSEPTYAFGSEEVSNSAPVVISINVTPSSPYIYENLSCGYTINDSDSALLNITGYWHKNGTLQTSLNFSRTNVPANATYADTLYYLNTTQGENWSCAVNATDGIAASALNYSNNVTIQNHIPYLNGYVLNPGAPYHKDDLNCSATAIDIDGDSMIAVFRFYLNGVINNSLNQTVTPVANNTYISALLDEGNTTFGQNWSCNISLDDLYGGVNSTMTGNVSIQNHISNISGIISLTPAPTAQDSDPLVCSFTINDDDADNMDVNVTWNRNGTAIYVSNYSSQVDGTLINDVLGAGNTTIGNIFNCSVRLTDGFETTNTNSTNTEIASLPPPSVFIISPADDVVTNAQGNTFSFICNASQTASITGMLWHNAVNVNNATCVNNSLCSIAYTTLINCNDYNWYIQCIDGGGRSNTSSTYNLSYQPAVL